MSTMVPKRQGNGHVLLVVAIAFVALAACCVMGCRPTDVLTEIIYDQSSEDVDYENENKYIINDSSSDIENPDLSSKEISEDAPANEEQQNLLVYSSEPNTRGFYTKASVFSMTPQFEGFEASSGVRYHLTNDEDALQYEVNEDELTEAAKRSLEMVHEDSGGAGVSDEGEAGDAGSNGEGSSSETGDANGDGGGARGAEGSGGSTGGAVQVSVKSARGKNKPPHVDSIATYGELAVIVQAIGGEGALAAADHKLLNSDFKKVFSDEGAKNIAEGWTDGGTTASKDNTNVQKIVDSGAGAILCYESTYLDDLSNSQKQKINDAGIVVVTVDSLASTSGLKNTVSKVGEMLSDSSKISKDMNPVQNASAYADFHDDLVDEVLGKNGGKLASADSKTYESGSSKYSYSSDAPYTLLIDGWDKNARFNKAVGDITPNSSEGVMLSTLGYKSRTTSYYMQVGGVINNAAAKFRASADGRKMVVWQFNRAQLDFREGYWDNPSSQLKNAYFPSSGSGWAFSLLETDLNASTSGATGGSYATPGSSFGTSTFPTVITASEDEKDAFIKNSNRTYGLYTPYDIATAGRFSYFGLASGKSMAYSCIGIDGGNAGTTNLLLGGIPDNDKYVKVNPCGLFSSWTEGKSMEAVLECAWINDEVQGNEDTVGWENKVKEFYQQIYRYDEFSSSDLKAITAGED